MLMGAKLMGAKTKTIPRPTAQFEEPARAARDNHPRDNHPRYRNQRKNLKYSLAEMQALLGEAGKESLERIAADLGRASWKIQPHLTEIQANLFEPDLDAGSLMETRGVNSSSTVDFHREMGTSLRDYVDQERVATAARLLGRCSLSLGDIAFLVGFSDRKVLSNVFQRHTGLRPTVFRQEWQTVVEKVGRPDLEVHNPRLLRELRTGDLDPDRAHRLLHFFERLERVGQQARKALSSTDDSAAERLAEEEWNRIADRDPDDRFIWVRDILRFNRPAFFFLLGRKIHDEIESNVPDLNRALGWAQLAMVHVEANAEELGEEATRPLRRQALDWLMNVRRRARALRPSLFDDRAWLEGQSVLWLSLLEGRLRLGLGEPDRANQLFSQVRTEAARRGWPMEAGLGALGMAKVLTAAAPPGCQIDHPEVADLVSQVIPALQGLTDQDNAQPLLRDLGGALRHGSLTPELLTSARIRLERLAPPARLRFRKSSTRKVFDSQSLRFAKSSVRKVKVNRDHPEQKKCFCSQGKSPHACL